MFFHSISKLLSRRLRIKKQVIRIEQRIDQHSVFISEKISGEKTCIQNDTEFYQVQNTPLTNILKKSFMTTDQLLF